MRMEPGIILLWSLVYDEKMYFAEPFHLGSTCCDKGQFEAIACDGSWSSELMLIHGFRHT